MAEETKTMISVDQLADARSVAQHAAAEFGAILPASGLRTAVVAAAGQFAGVFDGLMAHANELGVGELDADDLPDLGDLIEDDEAESGEAGGDDSSTELTVDQLKDRAKELGLTGYSGLNKADLADAVAKAEAESGEAGGD